MSTTLTLLFNYFFKLIALLKVEFENYKCEERNENIKEKQNENLYLKLIIKITINNQFT